MTCRLSSFRYEVVESAWRQERRPTRAGHLAGEIVRCPSGGVDWCWARRAVMARWAVPGRLSTRTWGAPLATAVHVNDRPGCVTIRSVASGFGAHCSRPGPACVREVWRILRRHPASVGQLILRAQVSLGASLTAVPAQDVSLVTYPAPASRLVLDSGGIDSDSGFDSV